MAVLWEFSIQIRLLVVRCQNGKDPITQDGDEDDGINFTLLQKNQLDYDITGCSADGQQQTEATSDIASIVISLNLMSTKLEIQSIRFPHFLLSKSDLTAAAKASSASIRHPTTAMPAAQCRLRLNPSSDPAPAVN